jgi:predicted DCC family thiol-disulfide oxidoreductase YuxK
MSNDSVSDAAEQTTARRPVVVWDGECRFCRRSVDYLERRLPDGTVSFVAYQQFDDAPRELSDDDFSQAVHLIRQDGTWSRGAEAIFEALAIAPDGGWGLQLYHAVPGFGGLTEWAYRWVADHRGWVDWMTTWLIGENLGPRGFRFARRAFVRAIGLVFVLAFVSFGVQAAGLVGSEGVLPATQRWSYLTGQPGNTFWEYPAIYWVVAPTDAVIWWTWVLGTAAAVLAMVGWVPGPALFVCWALYLSVVNLGGPFFSFQWDALLLESAWIAMLMTPWCWSLNGRAGQRRVSRAVLWLGWWLAFRLYFMSGVAKLLSGDPVWRNATALDYHFWTQPLPTWTAYYAAGLPDFVLSGLTLGMFIIEVIFPFWLFTPRRIRHTAAIGYAGLQVAILATGNYGFFNFLTLALCLLMVDDGAWRYLVPGGQWPTSGSRSSAYRSSWSRRLVLGVCTVVFAVGAGKVGAQYSLRLVGSRPAPQVVRMVMDASDTFDGFHSVNTYALFPNMTTRRPEFIVEGSRDGETWRRYNFRWKPDTTSDRPTYAVPHLPRLDWRLWFAALKGCPPSGWYRYLQVALLQGKGEVESLIAQVPFEDPPTYLRTSIQRFEFAGRKSETPVPTPAPTDWWQVTGPPTHCETVTLRHGELRTVDVQ